MGVSVTKVKTGKHKGKFILTHSVDGYKTKPLTKAEAILWLHRSRVCDMQQKFIESWFCFPHGWCDSHWKIIEDNAKGQKEWLDWWNEVLRTSRNDGSYFDKVDTMYNTVMAQTKQEAGQ